MIEMNCAILIGRLVADPEIHRYESGKVKASFCLAHTKRWGKGDDQKEETSFLDCEVWAHGANFLAKYCKKGARVCVEGSLKQERWTARDGGNRSKVIVSAFRVSADKDQPPNVGQPTDPVGDEAPILFPDGKPEEQDDLPF